MLEALDNDVLVISTSIIITIEEIITNNLMSTVIFNDDTLNAKNDCELITCHFNYIILKRVT